MRAKNILNDSIKQEIIDKATKEIDEQIEKAKRESVPAADSMFTYLLSETYPELEKQREVLLNEINQ